MPSDQRAVKDQFCIACGVSLDLHPSEGESDDTEECGVAARKADFITGFLSLGGRRHG